MEDLLKVTNHLSLIQSELYGKIYFNQGLEAGETFNEVSINNINDWFNSILTKHSEILRKQQFDCLSAFFRKLSEVLIIIDPEKLKFNNDLIEDSDIMIWRESFFGISKLVFDEYGQITYMFNGNDGKKVKGVFDITVDMEKLLYRFIAK